jgi:hypothetical protein
MADTSRHRTVDVYRHDCMLPCKSKHTVCSNQIHSKDTKFVNIVSQSFNQSYRQCNIRACASTQRRLLSVPCGLGKS